MVIVPSAARTNPCGRIRPPALYHPVIAPAPFIPLGYVKTDPEGSKLIIVPSGARTKPCVPWLPSVYDPAISPTSLMLCGSV